MNSLSHFWQSVPEKELDASRARIHRDAIKRDTSGFLKFFPMCEPYVYGYSRVDPHSGITVECVRSYVGEWSVFLTKCKTPVARCFPREPEREPFAKAMARARRVLRDLIAFHAPKGQ